MTHTSIRTLAIALLGLAGVHTAARAQDTLKVERAGADLINREQLAEPRYSNAYDLVESLHNNWLQQRRAAPADRARSPMDSTTGKAQYTADYSGAGKSLLGNAGGIQVYVDGTRVGSTEMLKQLRPLDLYSIRRMTPNEAQGRFGIGNGDGAIVVTTMGNAGKAP